MLSGSFVAGFWIELCQIYSTNCDANDDNWDSYYPDKSIKKRIDSDAFESKLIFTKG